MADSEDEFPPERDVKDFSFKEMRKIRMFEAPQSMPTARSCLLAVSSKYGLTFVGCPTGLKVIKTETIEKIHESDEGSMQNVVSHCPSSFIEIGHSVQFVGLSGDDLTLSVCYENGNKAVMALFDVPTLGNTNSSNAKFGEVTLGAGVRVLNLAWNPSFPSIFAVCLSSGSVSTMELTETEVKTLATLPANIKASAICWSPKGKQLVVGHKDGRLTQYSQVLQVKKEIECPELFTDDPHLVTDVLWISTRLFAAIYSSFEEGDCPKFLLISTPENEPVTITNFDDIYYAMSDLREPAFYPRSVSAWSLVVSACSNGLEAAVVGKYGGEAATPWEKWSFEEDGRPTMPLTSNNDESFPMGLAIDFSSTRPFVKGEERLPPVPIMLILSTDGVLCPFHMVNQTPNTNHDIVKPHEPLPPAGQRKTILSKMVGSVPQGTGGPGPTEKSPLQLGPVSLGTSGNLPVGAFSLGSANKITPSSSGPALPEIPGRVEYVQVGAFSVGISKQPSATSAGSAPSAFSFASPKQNVSLVSSVASSGTPGNTPSSAFPFVSPKQSDPRSSAGVFPGGTPASAFSLPGQQGGFAAYKPSSQTQVPATESVKHSATPQLVKPTPTNQTQSRMGGSPIVSLLQSPANAKPQAVILGRKQPKEISSTPSQEDETNFDDINYAMSDGREPAFYPRSVSARSSVVLSEGLEAAVVGKYGGEAATPWEKWSFEEDGRPETKQQISKKEMPAPVSKSNVIEVSLSQHIQEAISQFNEEMATLRKSVKQMQRNCCLTDDNKDLNSLRKSTNEISRSLAAIRDATKDQQKDINEEKRKLLEAFDVLEDARIRQERKSDPRYVQLLKSRALDPMNAKKMRDVRNLHLYLDKALREVNMVLDEEWNKENERKRSIHPPALDEIYKSLKMNLKIAQDQGAKLEKITEEMKNRKLLSTSWQRTSINTSSVRDDLMSNPFAVPKDELKSPPQRPSAPVSPEKQAQLRSMFQKRRNTPVRRSMIVPSTVAKTPTARPSKPQVPLLSSTPAVNPSIATEGTKGRFVISLPTPEQEKGADVDDNGSVSEEESETDGDEPHEDEQELKQLSAANRVPPGSAPGFSLGGTTFVPASSATGKDVFSAAVAKDEMKSAPGLSLGGTTFVPASSATGKDVFSAAVAKDEMKSAPGFSLGGTTFVPASSATGKDVFSAAVAKDEMKKPAAQPVRLVAPDRLQDKPTPLPAASGAFSAVGKPAGSQAASNTTQTEPPKASASFSLPASEEQLSTSAFSPGVKLISSVIPPNVAAGMAAMNRASAVQSAVQPSSNSNLDPSASIEPVTLVAYKPQTQGGGQAKDHDTENSAAKAIANAALMAATVEAQKPSAKPQCSTEFIFKSTDSGKPGPPVVTFKPPISSPQASESGGTVAPNVTVNPLPVFKPAFGPAGPSSSTAGSAGGLRLSLSGTQAGSPLGQLPTSSASLSFAPPASGLFNLGSSSGKTPSAPSQLSLSSKGSDVKAASQIPVVSSATTSSAAGITPSQRVSRNLFASGNDSSPAAPIGQDKSKEPSLPVTTASPSIASSSGISALATTATSFAFSAPSPGFFKNLDSASTIGSTFGSGDQASNSTSILGALVRSSGPGVTGSLFGGVPTALSTNAASATTPGSLFGGVPTALSTNAASATTPSTCASLSTGTPSENRDTSAANATTQLSVGIPANAGGVFAQALSESSKSVVAPPANTISTSPQTGNIFGSAATTAASTSAGLFGLPPSGSNAGVTAPSTTTAPSNLLGFSAGSPSSAFTVTSTTSPFFSSINSTSTTASTPVGSSPFNTVSTAPTITAVTSAPETSSTSALSGIFSNPTNTSSAFGVVPSAASTGFGSLRTAASTSAGGNLFGAPASTAFAPTSSVFGTSTSGMSFGSPQPFASAVSSQGSTFGSAPVFGSANTTAAPAFGGKATFGQSSFAPTTSSGFGQAASKPADNALGFGFGGFGLGGQGTSQTNKTNPFGAPQGFSAPATTQPSLFGGKSGDDIFKSSLGSGPFSQSGFGSQSSGGFTGGSFSAQGGSVLSSGFGFGTASSPGGSSGFGSSQPFGSPSAGASAFGGAPSFGSSPSFGGAPAFGSSPQGGPGATPSGGIFGAGSAGGFGQSSGSPTFGSLASQANVSSFGAIASQSPTQGFGSIQPQQQQSPSFGSFGGGSQSPSGVSFSQWR